MDFGYDLLANPQKIRCQTEIKPPNLNVGNNQNLIVDQIEDTIVESMPYIHSKIDNHTLREIIGISIRQYQNIEKVSKMKNFNYTPVLPKKIMTPHLEKPKVININPKNERLDLTKLH